GQTRRSPRRRKTLSGSGSMASGRRREWLMQRQPSGPRLVRIDGSFSCFLSSWVLPSFDLLQVCETVCESQRFQYTGAGLFHRKWLMAGVAVLRDCHFLIGSGVRSVMASEASRKIGVSQVVGVGPPIDLQVREHVPVIDGRDLGSCCGNVLCPLG